MYSGDGKEDENSPLAQNVLAFMAVALNGSYKVPLGYSPTVSMTGKEKANLVRLCLQKLSDIGAKVAGLVCDGPSTHFAMMTELGVSLKPDNMKYLFFHSSDKDQKNYTFLDVCHMLKCV